MNREQVKPYGDKHSHDPLACEVRIQAVGGLRVVRGRLAWLLLKLVDEGGTQLAEDVDHVGHGHLEVDWSTTGQVTIQTRRVYKLPA